MGLQELQTQLEQLRREYLAMLRGKVEELDILLKKHRAGAEGALPEAIASAHRIHGTAAAYGLAELGVLVGELENKLVLLQSGPSSPATWSAVAAVLGDLRVAAQQTSTPLPAFDPTAPKRENTVLVVDDDVGTQRFLSAALTGAGYQVQCVGTDKEARALLRQRHFPLAIVDWMLPDASGIDLVRGLRLTGRTPYTYIIMLTAKSGNRAFLEGMDAGADDLFTKPVDLDVLRARLRVAERMLALQGELSALRALVPICAYCGRINNEQGEWRRVEEYLAERSQTRFTHGMCEACADKLVGA